MSKKKRVKALALAIIRSQEKILVGECEDPSTKKIFYRPLGGSIEFGERACDTVVREFQEELGVAIYNTKQLGALENIFTYDGEPGHELILFFEAELRDVSLYQRESFPRLDKDGRAVWRAINDFSPKTPLYPEGLLSLL